LKNIGSRNLFLLGRKSPMFWVVLAALIASVAVLFIFRPTRTTQEKSIPIEALSKIHQEKAKAQKEFADFIQTPAGKIWEKHPYWDPAICEKIANGQVEPGMSKEQVKAALGEPKEVKPERRGEVLHEEWTVVGKEKWVLRFEENVLKMAERRK
jgi:hypothetical protein